MIDIEPQVFTAVKEALLTKFPTITVEGVLTNRPASFPSVSIEEADNFVVTGTSDSGNVENHASVMYEFNMFSNNKATRKSECKAISAVIDETMNGLGFVRITHQPLTFDSTQPYRIVSRYVAVVSANEIIYSRR